MKTSINKKSGQNKQTTTTKLTNHKKIIIIKNEINILLTIL